MNRGSFFIFLIDSWENHLGLWHGMILVLTLSLGQMFDMDYYYNGWVFFFFWCLQQSMSYA